jgi:glycyl-tRNA synthetase beta chain
MSTTAPLLIEIGCEEIPARMVPRAASDLAGSVTGCLERAGLGHGETRAWGGSRRLAVRIDDVVGRQDERDEVVLGPPAEIAFSADGEPTKAGTGFARKQGIDAADLRRIETAKGVYAGFERHVQGKSVGQVLADGLPPAVTGMSFPKSMRWGDGRYRWVRPVHWLLALHGGTVLPLELFGVRAEARSRGHRFLSRESVDVGHPDRYIEALEGASVIVDPEVRRERVLNALLEAAARAGGGLVEDPALLEEVSDLVEWPGVVTGALDPAFLELPRELLTTTLRHHQKCFTLQTPGGDLLPAFLGVANTDRDPGGHVRRGNEWVVGGRLEDARFFWNEDRREPLAERSFKLEGVVFHARVGTFADKARRMERLAGALARDLSLSDDEIAACRLAARLAKNDLVTSTVGEFPELQGEVGGLMLHAEGESEEVAEAVYDHYRPAGPEDRLPEGVVGRVVSVVDKLDSLAELIQAGEKPKGSRDPLGLRRAASGVFRIVIESQWPVCLQDLFDLAGTRGRDFTLTMQRMLENLLRERGSTANEIQAVLRPQVSVYEYLTWALHDIASRLEAIRTVRARPDFEHLVDLTKRVDNILSKDSDVARSVLEQRPDLAGYVERAEAALRLEEMTARYGRAIGTHADRKEYEQIVSLLAELVEPVERFFTEVLVLDPDQPKATRYRLELLSRLREVLTRIFDIRELAGQADGRE